MTFEELKQWCKDKGLKHRISKVRTDEVRCIHFFEKPDVPIVVYTEVSGNLQIYYVGYGHDHVEIPFDRIKTTSELDALYLKAENFDFQTSRTKRVWEQEQIQINRRQINF